MFQCDQSKATVVGLGATGLSLVRFLSKRGAQVTVVDASAAPAGLEQLHLEFPDVAFNVKDLAHETLAPTDFIALSPGVPRASTAISHALKRSVPVLGDIEIFAREVPDRAAVFAITGSNGKTTTTALAGELARCARSDTRAAGNIGVPILDALADTPDCSTWILELSSFQLESTESLRLASAAVINVTDNHLDRYPSFFTYAATKERIFANASEQVINRADVWSMSMLRAAKGAVTFGGDQPATATDFGIALHANEPSLVQGNVPILATAALGVTGAHNAQNALAALALTCSLNVSLESQREVLRAFTGMPHRCQLIATIDGIKIIDDSKATTVIATRAALEGLSAPTWLIAGGDGKGQQFSALGIAAARYCKAVHLIGRDAGLIAAALAANGVPCKTYSTLEDATHAALDSAKSGDQILLSPACASWDMFRNYGHRAEVFAAAVNDWANQHGRVPMRRGTSAS